MENDAVKKVKPDVACQLEPQPHQDEPAPSDGKVKKKKGNERTMETGES